MLEISSNIENVFYLLSASLFIIGLKQLASPATARNGNRLASVGMLIAIIITILKYTNTNFEWIIIGFFIGGILGLVLSRYVQMTAMPQLVAIFNAFGGGASALVAIYEIMYSREPITGTFTLASIAFATVIGSLTFTGSFIAFGKLQGIVSTRPILLPLRNYLNLILLIAIIVFAIVLSIPNISSVNFLYILIGLSLIVGLLIVIPIGGADMPVVVALLN